MTVAADSAADAYELSLIVVVVTSSGGGVHRKNTDGSLMMVRSLADITKITSLLGFSGMVSITIGDTRLEKLRCLARAWMYS